MINEEKIVLAEKNVVELCKALKKIEYLSLLDTWIFIKSDLANELVKSADEKSAFADMLRIQWRTEKHAMGEICLELKKSLWRKVYYISDGSINMNKPVYREKAGAPNKIIWIE